MPIASGGGSGSQKPSGSSAAAGANAVEFVISAKNEADRPLTLVTASLDKVKGGAESVSKSFEDMGKTASEAMDSVLKTIEEVAKKALPLLINTSNASGVALQKLWGIATSAAAGFNSLFEAVSNVYSILSSQPVTSFFDGLSQAAVKLISDTGRLSDTIKGLSSVSVGLGSGFTGVNLKPITTQFDGLLTKIDNIDAGFSQFVRNIKNSTNTVNTALGGLTTGLGFFSGIDEPLKMFEFLKGSVENAANAISGVSANIFFVISAIDQLKGVVLGGPFEILIGQNIKLQEQMLATQATLAATAQIMRDGIAIGDPGQAILEFAAPVRQTLSDIRKDSLELVGVTSNELVDVFQLVTQSLTDVKLSIGEAGKLSIAFAASLGTIGVPLYQARQEIQSILTGQIDQNSVLAKSIGLTNAQLKSWIAQDKVYERLNERLSAFVSGNQLASKTIGGLTSNIKEIFDEIGRRAGADFLPPIQDGVDEIYQFLLSKQDEMAKVVQNFLKKLSTAFGEVVQAIKPLLEALAPLGKGITKFISEAAIGVIQGFAAGIKTATAALAPFLDILGKLAQIVGSNPLIPLFVQLKVLQSAFGIATQFAGTFINTIPLAGEALFALKVRSLPVINAFGNLSAAFAGNVSALVNFGAAIVNTPAGLGILEKSVGNVTRGLSNFLATNQAASKIPLLSGLAGNTAVLGMFSGLLVSSTPALLGFAKNALAIGEAFGLNKEKIKDFVTFTPGKLEKVSETIFKFFGAESKIKFDGLIRNLIPDFDDLELDKKMGVDVIDKIESKLTTLGETTGKTVQSMIVKYGLWGAAIFSVATGISLMISKNEDLGKVVKWIADLIQSKVEPVLRFLGTGFGQLTLLAAGLTIAIGSGLATKVLELVRSFKLLAIANMPVVFKNIAAGIATMNRQIIAGTVLNGGNGFAGMFANAGVLASSFFNIVKVNGVGAFKLLGAAIAAAGEALAAFVVAYAPIIAISAAIGVVVATITRLLALEARRTEAVREYNKGMRETLELTRQLRKEKEGEVESDPLLKPKTAEEELAYKKYGEGGLRRIRYERDQQKDGIGKWYTNDVSRIAAGDFKNPFEIITVPFSATLAPQATVTSAYNRVKNLVTGSDEGFRSTTLTQNLAQDIKGQDLRVAEGRKTFADIFGSLPDIKKDGEGLNSKIVGEIRETQNLQQRIAQLNKEGNTSLAKVFQSQAEFRNKTLDKQLELARAEIEYQRSLDYLSGKQAADRDKYVAELERAIAVAEGVRTGEIMPSEPIENGTLLAQTQIDYRAFSKQLETGGGRILGLPQQIERYNNQLISSIQSLIQGNQLDSSTAEDAIGKLQVVAGSTTADPRTVQQAEETILAVRKSVTDRLFQEEERRQKGIELLRQKGQVSYLKGLEEERKAIEKNEEIRRREAKNTEIILRQNIENQRQSQNALFDKQIAAQKASTDAALKEQQKNNPADTEGARSILESGRQAIFELYKEKEEANNAYNTQLLERDRIFALQETEARVAYLKQLQEQEIRIVKETQDKITQQVAYSEAARNTQVQKLYNDRLIFEEDVNLLRSFSAGKTIDREIEAEKAALEQYKKYGATYEKEARQSEIKIQELLMKRLENEDNAWKAQLEVLKRNLKLQVDAFKNAKEEENKEILIQQKYLEALSTANEKRVGILSTAKDALTGTTSGVTGLLESLGTLTPNQGVKRNFDEAASNLRVNLLVSQYELEKKMYDIQQQQNKIALKRQIIEAELLSIQAQQLLIEKSGELKQAQAALSKNPGDRQAQIDVESLSREVNALAAQLVVADEQKNLSNKALQANKATQGIRDTNFALDFFNNLAKEVNTSIANLPRALQTRALESYRGVLEKFLEENTDIKIDFTQFGDLRQLAQLLAQLTRSAAGNLTGNPDAFAIPVQPVATTRAQQQEANQNILREKGFNLRGLTPVNSAEFADPFIQPLVANSEEKINSMFPILNKALVESGKAIDLIGDTSKDADKSVSELLASSEALIQEQMPDLQEQLDIVSNTQLPTAESVLAELGTRLDVLSQESIPGVQESIDIITNGAVSSIDGIVNAVETKLPGIEEQFKSMLDDILADISTAKANLQLPTGSKKEKKEVPEVPASAREESLRLRLEAQRKTGTFTDRRGAVKTARDLYVLTGKDDDKKTLIQVLKTERDMLNRTLRDPKDKNPEATRRALLENARQLALYDPTRANRRQLERLEVIPTTTPSQRNRRALSAGAERGAVANTTTSTVFNFDPSVTVQQTEGKTSAETGAGLVSNLLDTALSQQKQGG